MIVGKAAYIPMTDTAEDTSYVNKACKLVDLCVSFGGWLE